MNFIKLSYYNYNYLKTLNKIYYFLGIGIITYLLINAYFLIKIDFNDFKPLSDNLGLIAQIIITLSTFILTVAFTGMQFLCNKYSDFKVLLKNEYIKLGFSIFLLVFYVLLTFFLLKFNSNIFLDNVLFYFSIYYVISLFLIIISTSLLFNSSQITCCQKDLLIKKISKIDIFNKYSKMPDEIIDGLEVEVEIINRIANNAILTNCKAELIESLDVFKTALIIYFTKINVQEYDKFVEYVSSKYTELFDLALTSGNQSLISVIAESINLILLETPKYNVGHHNPNYLYLNIKNRVEYIITKSLNLKNTYAPSLLIKGLISTMLLFDEKDDFVHADSILQSISSIASVIMKNKNLFYERAFCEYLTATIIKGNLNHIKNILLKSYNGKGINSEIYLKKSLNNLTTNIKELINNDNFDYIQCFLSAYETLNLYSLDANLHNLTDFYSRLKNINLCNKNICNIIDIFSFICTQDLNKSKHISLTVYFLEQILDFVKEIKIANLNSYDSQIYVAILFIVMRYKDRLIVNKKELIDFKHIEKAFKSFISKFFKDIYYIIELQIENKTNRTIICNELILIIGILLYSDYNEILKIFTDKLIKLYEKLDAKTDNNLHYLSDILKTLKIVGLWNHKSLIKDTYTELNKFLSNNYREAKITSDFYFEDDKLEELYYPKLLNNDFFPLINYYLSPQLIKKLSDLLNVTYKEMEDYNEFLKNNE